MRQEGRQARVALPDLFPFPKSSDCGVKESLGASRCSAA